MMIMDDLSLRFFSQSDYLSCAFPPVPINPFEVMWIYLRSQGVEILFVYKGHSKGS
jgi:hypothetical protein